MSSCEELGQVDGGGEVADERRRDEHQLQLLHFQHRTEGTVEREEGICVIILKFLTEMDDVMASLCLWIKN